jgi:hypothetical protein
MQLAYYSFQFLVTAIAFHTGLTLLKVQVIVAPVAEVQSRDLMEIEVPVEVQLTVTSTNRRSRRSNRGRTTTRTSVRRQCFRHQERLFKQTR